MRKKLEDGTRRANENLTKKSINITVCGLYIIYNVSSLWCVKQEKVTRERNLLKDGIRSETKISEERKLISISVCGLYVMQNISPLLCVKNRKRLWEREKPSKTDKETKSHKPLIKKIHTPAIYKLHVHSFHLLYLKLLILTLTAPIPHT